MVQIEAPSTQECVEDVLSQGGQWREDDRPGHQVPNLNSGLVPVDPDEDLSQNKRFFHISDSDEVFLLLIHI